MVALSELYALMWDSVCIFIPQYYSSTVTAEVASWHHSCEIVDEILSDDRLILVDVSDYHYLWDQCKYKLDNVIEIYDHHPWSEQYRKKLIWTSSQIEQVWAAATLIFEQAQEHIYLDQLSDTAIQLLYTAIISNTLNFSSLVTTCRDITAHNVLLQYIQKRWLLSSNWKETYFGHIDVSILKDPKTSITMDMKPKVKVNDVEYTIWQLELRESKEFLLSYKELIWDLHSEYNNQNRFFTCPSISEGKTYILAENEELLSSLWEVFDIYSWEWWYYQVDRLVLRKQWIRWLFEKG